VKVFLRDDNPLSEAYLRYKDMFEQSNKYDCVILNRNLNERILSEYKNILLIEKLDGAAIWCRKLLKHPHVKTLLKMYHYPDLNTNNRLSVCGRLFVPYDGNEKPQEPELTAEDMSKVRPGLNFLHLKRMNDVITTTKALSIKPINDRSIYSFFAGTTSYKEDDPSGKWITEHRHTYINILKGMKNSGKNVIISENVSYSPDEYIKIMLDSKFIFSPFGWGEFCYRDYEAILCGCVLIKPIIEYISHVPDIQRAMNFKFNDNLTPDLEMREILIQSKENEKQIIKNILE
jgi:hypothetical protein